MSSTVTTLNKTTLLGTLCSEPITKEIVTSRGPSMVTTFRFKTRKSNGRGYVFLDVDCYGTRSAIAQRLQNRRQLIVIGSIDQREYWRRDNTKATETRICAEELVFLDNPEIPDANTPV
jgi:single-stranded DNA-binding protein